jgi:ribosomal protein S8
MFDIPNNNLIFNCEHKMVKLLSSQEYLRDIKYHKRVKLKLKIKLKLKKKTKRPPKNTIYLL